MVANEAVSFCGFICMPKRLVAATESTCAIENLVFFKNKKSPDAAIAKT